MEIFKLFGSILVDSDKANESISRTEKNAEGLGKRLGNGIKTAAKWGLAVGAGVMAAGTAIVGLAKKAGDAADRLLDLADITGMTTDEIQRWESVSRLAGVSTDAMTNASQRLTRSLSAMDSEGNKSRKAVEQLGLSFQAINNMNADERMNALVKSLADIEDPTERARIGTDLFGGAWKDIAPIVGLGVEEMEKAKDAANIFSEEDLQKANSFRISMDRLRERIGFLAMNLAIKLLPAAEVVFGVIEKYAPIIMHFAEVVLLEVGRMITWLIEKISDFAQGFDSNFSLIAKVLDFFREHIQRIIKFVRDWQERNAESLESIRKSFERIFTAIYDIISIFVRLVMWLWNVFGDDIMKVASIVWDTITGIVDGAFKIISGLLDFFIGLFTGDWERMGEGLKSIWSGVWTVIESIVKGAWNLLRGAFSSLYDKIKGWFLGVVDDAYNWGVGIITGFIDGIKSMINKAGEAAKDVVGQVAKFLKFWSPAKEGEGRFITQWGENMIEGFLDGVRKATPEIEKTLNRVIPNMGQSLVPVAANNTVEHKHTGVLRIEGVNSKGQMVDAVKLVVNELRRELRM